MSEHQTLSLDDLPPVAAQFYRNVMKVLRDAEIGFLVGGGHAFYRYTSISRDTKDFDIFIMPQEVPRVLELLRDAGYETEHKYPHWLGKIYHEGYFVDVICSSGNGVCPVDEQWFKHGKPDTVLGRHVQLVPVEEMIWQKAFIMERHRFDGSDINHLLHYHSESLDWDRVLSRFADHWPVLMSHLLLYRFAYPDDRSPRTMTVVRQLANQLIDSIDQLSGDATTAQLCRGTLLSLLDYLPAIKNWGYQDARLIPNGNMTPSEVAHWTNTFEK